jgi:hypothetical protein
MISMQRCGASRGARPLCVAMGASSRGARAWSGACVVMGRASMRMKIVSDCVQSLQYCQGGVSYHMNESTTSLNSFEE